MTSRGISVLRSDSAVYGQLFHATASQCCICYCCFEAQNRLSFHDWFCWSACTDYANCEIFQMLLQVMIQDFVLHLGAASLYVNIYWFLVFFCIVWLARFEVIAVASSSGLWRRVDLKILTWRFGVACCLHVPGLSGEVCSFVGLLANRLLVMSRKTLTCTVSLENTACVLCDVKTTMCLKNTSVCDLVSTTKPLSDFREIRYRSSWQKSCGGSVSVTKSEYWRPYFA